MSAVGPRRRFPRTVLAASVLVAAVALGVLVGLLVRPGGPMAGPSALRPDVTTGSPETPETPEPAPSGPFGETSRRVSSGAHRVIATTCGGTGIGTAYQFGSDGLLVTSARTVSGAQTIAIASGNRVVPAEVAKIDARAGLALLKPASRLPGHIFRLSTRQLHTGDEVAAFGWTAQAQQPARGKLRVAVGTIGETDAVPSPEGNQNLRRMTGEFDPGLAGAPVTDADGLLLGMLVQTSPDQRDLHVAGMDTIADALLGPTGMPPDVDPCPVATGPEVATSVAGPAATATRAELGRWYSALNAGDWGRARGVLTEELRGEWSADRLAREYAGTYHLNLVAATPGSSAGVTWVRLGPQQSCVRGVTEFRLNQGRITGMAVSGEPAPCG